LAAAVDEGDPRPLGGEGPDDGPADPPAAAGHDGDLFLQAHLAFTPAAGSRRKPLAGWRIVPAGGRLFFHRHFAAPGCGLGGYNGPPSPAPRSSRSPRPRPGP